jgi:hypothetical protein
MGDSVWSYRSNSGYQAGTDLIGYKVETEDGQIGKVDKHTDDVGAAYLVVDTGMWIFGKHVLLPAGTISRVDHDDNRVYVSHTKDEIKDAPEFDKDKHPWNVGYHEQVGDYYNRPRV